MDVPVDVLQGNKIENYTVRSTDREKYLRPKRLY